MSLKPLQIIDTHVSIKEGSGLHIFKPFVVGGDNSWKIIKLDDPTLGLASIAANGKSINYVPKHNSTGIDSFNFTILENSIQLTACIDVVIEEISEDIQVYDIMNVINQDTKDFALLPSVSGGNNWSIKSVTEAKNGSVVIDNERRILLYTPNPGYFGADSFDYTIIDGKVIKSAKSIITINQMFPTLQVLDAEISLQQDSEPVSIYLAVIGGSGNWFVDSMEGAKLGVPGLSLTNPKVIKYTPNAGAVGEDTFMVTIKDGAQTAKANVHTHVAAVKKLPTVNFEVAKSDTIPEIKEDPTNSTYYRVNITRSLPLGAKDEGLTVNWVKEGYQNGDVTKWKWTGITVFPVGVFSRPFDVEAEKVLDDRLITSRLVDDPDYHIGDTPSFKVSIRKTNSIGQYTGDLWYRKHFVPNSLGIPVSAYTRNFINSGPNFFASSAHDKWIAYMGALDAVNGSGRRNKRGQNWLEYIGGPVEKGPTYIDPNSWVNLYDSDHIKSWWNYAKSYPKLWLIVCCCSMPSFSVDSGNTAPYNTPRVTAQEQFNIIFDIISGKKDAELIMLGQRLRYAIEHECNGVRAGFADQVILRVNWEFQHTTSLSIGSISNGSSDDFMTQMVNCGKAKNQLEAIVLYRNMMHKWCQKVKEGYSKGWSNTCPAATLRIALSTAIMSHRGFDMEEMIHPDGAKDYDLWDHMYHANRVKMRTYQDVINMFYVFRTTDYYNHACAIRAAQHWNLPYASLENGPVFDMNTPTSPDLWWNRIERAFTAIPNWQTNQAVDKYHYRIESNNVFQCIEKGPSNSIIKPTIVIPDKIVTYSDGYKWAYRLNYGRNLGMSEFSEWACRDFFINMGNRAAFVGSYHASSMQEEFYQDTWANYDKSLDYIDSKRNDWGRFVRTRKNGMFGKK